MSVVVTGAAGFIGRHVVTTLRSRGYTVVGIDRRRWTPGDGEEVLVTDVSAPDGDARQALAAADAVIHLAGCPGVRDRAPDVAQRRYRDNVLAGQRILDLTPADTPLVVASSSSIYGGSRDGRACHEDDPRRPLGGYARSKAALEERCDRRRASGGQIAVLRPFTVAGEAQRPDMAISRWLAAAVAGEAVTVLGSLDRVRDVTDVRDVAEGLVRAAEREVDTVCNLGTGRVHRLWEVIDAVTAVTGRRPPVRVVPAGTEEVPATRADTRRCARLLGFVPHTDLHALVVRQFAATHTRSSPTLDLEVV